MIVRFQEGLAQAPSKMYDSIRRWGTTSQKNKRLLVGHRIRRVVSVAAKKAVDRERGRAGCRQLCRHLPTIFLPLMPFQEEGPESALPPPIVDTMPAAWVLAATRCHARPLDPVRVRFGASRESNCCFGFATEVPERFRVNQNSAPRSSNLSPCIHSTYIA